MKRLLLVFLFFIFSVTIYSQRKLFVSIDASPTYSFRTYKLVDYSSGSATLPSGKVLNDKFLNNSDSIESPKFGYQIAVNIGYQLTDKFVLITGCHFVKIGNKIEGRLPSVQYVVEDNIISSLKYGPKLDLYSDFYYLGIPISLQYKAYTISKFKIGLEVGGSIDYLVDHDSRHLSNSKEDYSTYPQIDLSIHAGLQLGYTINDKFEVYMLPQFTHYITPNEKIDETLSNDFFVKINQYNYYSAIKVGLKYQL